MRPLAAALAAPLLALLLALLVLALQPPPATDAFEARRPRAPLQTAVVISLARTPHRFATFAAAYGASDLAGTRLARVEAVDGLATDLARHVEAGAMERLREMQRTGHRRGHPDLTPGAVGCYLSHLRAWRAVAASGAPYGLVFEDDARVPVRVRDALQRAVEGLPPDWDILLLGHEGEGERAGPGVLRMRRFLRLHAYAISARAASRLPDAMLPIRQQVDWELSSRIPGGLRVFATDPQLVPVEWKGTTVQSPLAPSTSDR